MINSKQPLTTDMASTSTETAEIGWLNQFQYLFYFFLFKINDRRTGGPLILPEEHRNT